jgi:hypothetical protein
LTLGMYALPYSQSSRELLKPSLPLRDCGFAREDGRHGAYFRLLPPQFDILFRERSGSLRTSERIDRAVSCKAATDFFCKFTVITVP